MPGFFDAAEPDCDWPCGVAAGVAFDKYESLGAPEYKGYGARSPRPHTLLSTLHQPPRGGQRMTRRVLQNGSLLYSTRDLHPLSTAS